MSTYTSIVQHCYFNRDSASDTWWKLPLLERWQYQFCGPQANSIVINPFTFLVLVSKNYLLKTSWCVTKAAAVILKLKPMKFVLNNNNGTKPPFKGYGIVQTNPFGLLCLSFREIAPIFIKNSLQKHTHKTINLWSSIRKNYPWNLKLLMPPSNNGNGITCTFSVVWCLIAIFETLFGNYGFISM